MTPASRGLNSFQQSLAPVIQFHRLVVNADLILKDFESTQGYSVEHHVWHSRPGCVPGCAICATMRHYGPWAERGRQGDRETGRWRRLNAAERI
jgi:hypothetical protein